MGFGVKQADITAILSKVTPLPSSPANEATLSTTEGYALNAQTYSQQGITKRRNQMDFWMSPVSGYTLGPSITISTTPTLLSLGTWSLANAFIPTDITIAQAKLLLKFRELRDDSAADNQLDGAQLVRVKSTGDFITAINFAGGELSIDVDTSPVGSGDVIIGDQNIRAALVYGVSGWEDIDASWPAALALGDNFYMIDIQLGLRITFYQ